MYQPIKTASSLPILIEKTPKDTFSLPIELLKIPDIRIIEIDFNYNECIIIDVESINNETCCHHCGRKTEKTDGNEKPRLIRHLPIFSTETYLRISPKRCQCDCGAITIQTFSWYTPKSSCTSIYEDHLLLQIINSTISDVSIKEKIGYDLLKNIIDRKIDTSPDWKHIKKLKSLVLMKFH
ncbi:MAG: transposase family protein [Sulfurovaceae bacterium]|nr:transposase family protein [Sulfurovaceae bacterium]